MLISPHCQSLWNHGKVTAIILSQLVSLADNSSRHLPSPVHTIWGWWWSNVAVWMQPVAYSCTDVDFDSDVWMCLDVDITTLAKSLKSWQSHCNHIVTTGELGRRFIKTFTCTSPHNLRMVMIQCGGMDATSSLFMHWCWLWLWCKDVSRRWYHHNGKVTEIMAKSLQSYCHNKLRTVMIQPVHTIWGWWWSNVAFHTIWGWWWCNVAVWM